MQGSLTGRKIVGIDLGTTFSAIAYINDYGKPETILNSDGQTVTPSAVLFDGPGNIVVGQMARDSAIAAADRVVTLVKREMGRDTKFSLAGHEFTPEQISAMILKKLKQDAEERLGMSISDAVITVPAYFGAAERKATQDAGEMAGFTVHHIVNEPTAAALAFGFTHPDTDHTMLVYDLGGGTFDITLLRISPPASGSTTPRVETISTGGNHDLGGANWDEAIMGYVAEQFYAACREDPRDELSSKQDLYIRCERAKVALSRVTSARITCQHAGKVITVDLDRATLFRLTRHLLDLTETELDKLLADKGRTAHDIEKLLLVGGSTKLLMVREMLERKFPGKLDMSMNPDEAVAQGAAWMGYLIGQGALEPQRPAGGNLMKVRKPPIIDVMSHALGVKALRQETNQWLIYPIIVKDAQVPCENTRTFYTLADNQTAVEFPVYENDARNLDDVTDLDAGRQVGTVILEGLPAGRPKDQPLEVTFAFDRSLRLTVIARDVGTGIAFQGVFDIGSGLTQQTKSQTTKMLAGTVVQG